MANVDLPFETSHAFIIGIDNYLNTTKLSTAVADALDIKVILEAHGYLVHEPLLDEAASKENIEKLISEEIPELINPKDRLIFYFAGHGIAFDSEVDPRGFLIPVDADLDQQESLVAMSFLKENMDRWDCKHGLLIMDCCFAGAFRWSMGLRAIRRRKAKVIYAERFLRYTTDPAWQIITSASADEEAIDVLNKLIGTRPNTGNSPFATALKEGLAGAADFKVLSGKKDGVITATELYVYLRDRVQEMTASSPVKQTPAIFNLGKHGKGEFMFVNSDPTVPFNLPPFPARNPYMGLSSFTENDATLFFGREDQVDALWQKVQAHSFTIVTAGSGTGKTSLVQAGLIPQLRAIRAQGNGGVDGETKPEAANNNNELSWNIVSIPRTGNDPLAKLEMAHPGWETKLADQKTILIVDQYEEALGGGLSAKPWIDFEAKMAALIGAEKARLTLGEEPRFKLVLVVRSDYELLLHGIEHPLKEWWTDSRYFVPPFSEEDLLEVIEQPARQSVLFFEPEDFPITLLNEVDQSPRALPILSFTLNNLYEKFVQSGREDRTLKEQDYRDMGGLIGALSSRADQVYEELGAADNGEALQRMMKKIVLRLLKIENGQFVRRKVPILPIEGLFRLVETTETTDENPTEEQDQSQFINELDFQEDEQDQWLKEVLSELVSKQLVTISSGSDPQNLQPYLEPIHDALINFWPACLRWIQEFGPNNIVLQEVLWKATVDNINRAEKTEEERNEDITLAASHLWDRHPRLEEVKAILAGDDHWFNQVEVDFINRSWNKKNKIVEQLRKERDEARSSALSARAMLANQENPTRAFNLAMKAYEAARIQDTCQAIADISSASNALFYRRFTTGLDQISAIAVAPEGDRYILGSDLHPDANLIEYDHFDDFHGGGLTGHSLKIQDIAFSSDGHFMLTGSHDKTAILWNRDGVQQQVFTGHTGPVFSVSFLPPALPDENGEIPNRPLLILTASSDGTAKLWDLEGNMIQDFQVGGIVWSAAFSHDGQQVLTAGSDGKARLWDLNANLIQVFEEEGHSKDILSVAMSLDGGYVLTGGADHKAILWERDGKKFFEIDEHTGQVNSVCFSPTGKHLLTVGQDGRAVLGLLEDYQPQVFIDEGQPFKGAAFSPDGKKLLIASRDGRIIHQDLQGMMVRSYPDHGFGISPVIFAPEEPLLFIGSKNNTGVLMNLEEETSTEITGHTSSILSAVFSADGNFLLTGSMDNTARLWNLTEEPSQPTRVITSENDTIWAVALSKDNTTIYTAGSQKEIRRWRLDSEAPEVIGTQLDDIMAIALSPDERFLLSGGRNGSVIYWNLEEGSRLPLESHAMETMTTAISPDGQWLLSGGGSESDGKAILYDNTGLKKTELIHHKGAVTSASFSSDGEFILTTSKDNTAAIWNLEGRLLQTLKGHQENIWSGCFSPDARWIATKSLDQTVKIWHHYMLAWEEGWMDQLVLDVEFKFGAVQADLT